MMIFLNYLYGIAHFSLHCVFLVVLRKAMPSG